MSGKRIAHCGAQYIDRAGLKALETPPSTDTWTPIPQYELVGYPRKAGHSMA